MIIKPSERDTRKTGRFAVGVEEINQHLASCDLCPRVCLVNRMAGELGDCRVGKEALVASYGAHLGEEYPLRGWRGSGTIFFGGCNLGCIFCQNAEISQKRSGKPTSAVELAGIMLELQDQGCHNINLVSPTHVTAQLAESLDLASWRGLNIPVVYNCGGYESVGTLKMLEGMVDIYLPDMKYSDPRIGLELSGVPDYPSVNREAILEMHRQVGDLKVDGRGLATRGMLIRHLVLPHRMAGSESTLRFIADEISTSTYLNIMDQYRPSHLAHQDNQVNRPITRAEFQEVLDMANALGFSRIA